MSQRACAGLETAITRTPLATALILADLSGQTGVTVPCLASAMVSLYITLYRPFIASQRDRTDVIIRVCPPPPGGPPLPLIGAI